MSVFGPRDKDVPLLTQIYQLDIADPDDPDTYHNVASYHHSDLDKWLGRFWLREYWSDGRVYMPAFTEYSDPEVSAGTRGLSEADQSLAFETNFIQKEFNEYSRRRDASSDLSSGFSHLIRIIALVKRIMTTVCDSGEIAEEDVKLLSEQSKLYQPTRAFFWKAANPGRFGQERELGYIPVSDLEISDNFSPTINGLEWPVLDSLAEALAKAQKTPGYFQRCEQCHNVFLRERGQAIYCSRRCNVRAQTRRWRKRESLKL